MGDGKSWRVDSVEFQHSKRLFGAVQPQIILRNFRATAVIAFGPGIFCTVAALIAMIYLNCSNIEIPFVGL